MHKRFLSSLLLAALAGTLLLGSCGLTGSSEKKKAKSDSTFFLATLNGEEVWSGKPNATFSKQGRFDWLALFADSMYNPGLYKEQLSFHTPFQRNGEYSMVEVNRELDDGRSRISGASFYVNEGDVLLSTYSPTDDTLDNQLMITSYDTTTGIMEGTFRTTVVVDSADRESEPGEPPRHRPDTLRFTNGEFRVEVEDRRDQ
jgi:hypothetical protein